MFAEMRTGSNFLEANLNALHGVSCLGELFNPFFIGKKDQTEMFGVTLAQRESDPMALIAAARAATGGMVGFRWFHDHDPRVFDAVMADTRCAKIVLTRNPVESYVSLKIAQATGQWKLTNPKNLKQAKARFDSVEFEAHLDAVQGFQVRLLNALQTSGQTAFYLDYEDIQDLAVLNGLAAFLRVDARLDAVDQSLTVQNPEPLADKVTNPAAMEQALARLDRFNLSRTPNFEPRRTAGIPGFIASREVPLLFMPLRGGPEARVVDWLEAFGGLERDFVQKSLRQWKRAHAGHRSFTVLRHPVDRAWAAFKDAQGSGLGPEQRNILSRVHGVAFPKQGYASVEEERAAFVAFLRFLKRNIAGQTGFRTPAAWASQTALTQGFALFNGPDAVLREDRLPEGLSWLCAEVGVAMPPLRAAEPSGVEAVLDASVEDAAREAYQRDYMGFGFGPRGHAA
ncbi:nodulation protein NodH [Paragemmobacter straminiformis]|nr:nodulation protein NodH [Gemmobacter straminiformis]